MGSNNTRLLKAERLAQSLLKVSSYNIVKIQESFMLYNPDNYTDKDPGVLYTNSCLDWLIYLF